MVRMERSLTVPVACLFQTVFLVYFKQFKRANFRKTGRITIKREKISVVQGVVHLFLVVDQGLVTPRLLVYEPLTLHNSVLQWKPMADVEKQQLDLRRRIHCTHEDKTICF